MTDVGETQACRQTINHSPSVHESRENGNDEKTKADEPDGSEGKGAGGCLPEFIHGVDPIQYSGSEVKFHDTNRNGGGSG
jgi:hypothetical protein